MCITLHICYWCAKSTTRTKHVPEGCLLNLFVSQHVLNISPGKYINTRYITVNNLMCLTRTSEQSGWVHKWNLGEFSKTGCYRIWHQISDDDLWRKKNNAVVNTFLLQYNYILRKSKAERYQITVFAHCTFVQHIFQLLIGWTRFSFDFLVESVLSRITRLNLQQQCLGEQK